MFRALLLSMAVVAGVLVAAAPVSANEWKEFKSELGRYSVQFPGPPLQRTQRNDTKLGKLDQKVSLFSQNDAADAKNDVFYAAAFLDYPKDGIAKYSPDELLDFARDSAVANVKGTLIHEDKITVNNFPGRELKIAAPGDLVLTARIYQVKTRAYQAFVVSNKDRESKESTKRFLDSFKFTP